MDDNDLRTILESATTIAVVGASTDPDKAANHVPAILIEAGYDVVPVHPKASEILGRPAYPSLADVPRKVDIVDVFRPADEAPGVVEQADAIGAPVVWVQLGIVSPEARRLAGEAGVTYLDDICIGETVRRLDTHPPAAGS